MCVRGVRKTFWSNVPATVRFGRVFLSERTASQRQDVSEEAHSIINHLKKWIIQHILDTCLHHEALWWQHPAVGMLLCNTDQMNSGEEKKPGGNPAAVCTGAAALEYKGQHRKSFRITMSLKCRVQIWSQSTVCDSHCCSLSLPTELTQTCPDVQELLISFNCTSSACYKRKDVCLLSSSAALCVL